MELRVSAVFPVRQVQVGQEAAVALVPQFVLPKWVRVEMGVPAGTVPQAVLGVQEPQVKLRLFCKTVVRPPFYLILLSISLVNL